MNEENMKIGMIDQSIFAMSKTKEYPSLVKQKMSRALSFALLLSILLTMITYIVPMIGYQYSLGGLENFFTERIPTFSIEKGEMTMDGTLDIQLAGFQLKADSQKERYTKEDVDSDLIGQVLISKSNLLFKDLGQVFEIQFVDIPLATINNQSLVGLIPYIHGIEIGMFFVLVLATFFRYLVGAVGYALVGMTFTSMQQIPLTFSELFKIGIYCKVFSALASAINETLGYPIPFEYWYSIGMIISLVYLTRGIAAHRKNEPSKGSM